MSSQEGKVPRNGLRCATTQDIEEERAQGVDSELHPGRRHAAATGGCEESIS